MLIFKTAIDQVVAGGFVKRDVRMARAGNHGRETGGCASFIFLSCGAYHISCYLHTYTYYCFLSGSDWLKIQNHQNHKPAFMINRTCEDLKPFLAATGSHFDTGVGPWQLSNRRFDEISEMVKPHSERVQMGLSENRVYPQWNSHLVGIMISKTIGFRGFHHIFRHTQISTSAAGIISDL